MAPQIRPIHPLRIVTQKIANTPTERLPLILPYLTTLLLNCSSLLSESASKRQSKNGSDTAVLLHKYKTQLSTLSQEKSAAGRWCAVVLIKATVEAGGSEIVQESGPWIRALLGYLTKKDPAATKKATVTTLTRIFLLTRGNPAVIREIATPALSPFITNCLNCILSSSKELGQSRRHVNVQSPILKIVLQAFITLLPHHPTSFRPFLGQIRSMLSALIAPTPSTLLSADDPEGNATCTNKAVTGLAQTLLALLPYSAQKNNLAEEWNKTVHTTIKHAHATVDHVFRAIVEENTRPATFGDLGSSVKISSDVLSNTVDDVLDLPAWQGIDAGSERLIGCLQILQAHVVTPTATAISLPLGAVWSLTERILSVFDPSLQSMGGREIQSSINPQIERDEREGLWSRLPEMHEACIDTLSVMVQRMRQCSISMAEEMLERIGWLFQKESNHRAVRIASYKLVSQLLCLLGPSLSEEKAKSVEPILRAACSDVLPPEVDVAIEGEAGKEIDTSSSLGRGALLQAKAVKAEENLPTSSPLSKTASGLLQTALSRIRAKSLPSRLRALIDRTIILTQDRTGMTASVLNPPTASLKDASILPFLARAFPASPATEAILRPRLPVIKTRTNGLSSIDDEDSQSVMDYDQMPTPQPLNHSIAEIAGREPLPEGKEAVSTSQFQEHMPHVGHESSLVQALAAERPSSPEVMSPKRARESENTLQHLPSADPDIPTAKRLREVERTEQPLPERAEALNANSSSNKPELISYSFTGALPREAKAAQVGGSRAPEKAAASGDASESDSGSDIPPIILDSDTDDDDDDDDEGDDEVDANEGDEGVGEGEEEGEEEGKADGDEVETKSEEKDHDDDGNEMHID